MAFFNVPVYAGEPARGKLKALASNARVVDPKVSAAVTDIISEVREQGDDGLRAIAKRLGDDHTGPFEIELSEIDRIATAVSPEIRRILSAAEANVGGFARAVAESVESVTVKRDGFETGLDFVPVATAGCYVPAGRFPLPSTAIMTCATARAAGVREIVACSPRFTPEIALAARIAGATRFFRIGGAQAVAAMALGTGTVPRVDVIAGPGNAYVTEAKRQLCGFVGIDLVAGPSEVVVIADKGARQDWVALDLLAQAEHGPDATAILLTWDDKLARAVPSAVAAKAAELGLAEGCGRVVVLVLRTPEECAEASDAIAPEHLHLQIADPSRILGILHNFGAAFIGYESPVAFGDYMAGPNHTLPTGGAARFSGCLNPLTFMRPRSWVRMGAGAANLSMDVAAFATMEGLKAHAASAAARGETRSAR